MAGMGRELARFSVFRKPCLSPSILDDEGRLADRTFHLQLNEAIHFNGVFHGQFFDERFDEAVDDHGAGFGLSQPATHQVEELFFANSRNARFVADGTSCSAISM